jgi:mannose-6-phosphate isomerase-like protein (cupin superfamily)
MTIRLRFLTILLLAAWAGRSEIRDILKSSEIDALMAKTQKSTDVMVKTNYIISLRVQTEPGSFVTHPDADEIWLVRRGEAKLSLGESTLATGVKRTGKDYDLAKGDVVNVPRTMAYLLAPSSRLEYVVIQIFPTERHFTAGRGGGQGGRGGGQARPMPDVVPNATIQDTFLKNTTNQPLHSLGAASMNHVIYNGAPGPYEIHLGCDDLYFVRLGSGTAKLDGRLLDPKEESPGEIRGTTGVYGAREHKIGVGDILVIPRNTVHYMDPGNVKLGYLLLKVWE